MEDLLKYEIEQAIPELKDRIFPTNAPEKHGTSYLVYTRINTNIVKVFEGFKKRQSATLMFSVMSTRYADMKILTKKVENFLTSLPLTEIGIMDKIYIADVDINNISETYEFDLKKNRGIIDFTIYY